MLISSIANMHDAKSSKLPSDAVLNVFCEELVEELVEPAVATYVAELSELSGMTFAVYKEVVVDVVVVVTVTVDGVGVLSSQVKVSVTTTCAVTVQVAARNVSPTPDEFV